MGPCTYPHVNVVDAFVAEALVCEQALRFTQEVGFQHIQV